MGYLYTVGIVLKFCTRQYPISWGYDEETKTYLRSQGFGSYIWGVTVVGVVTAGLRPPRVSVYKRSEGVIETIYRWSDPRAALWFTIGW